MHRHWLLHRAWLALLLACVLCPTLAHAESMGRFIVSLDPAATSDTYTGRLYIVLAPAESLGKREPRQLISDWFDRAQVFTLDVAALRPGQPVTLSASCAHGFPRAFDRAAKGSFRVQAVARTSLDSCSPGAGAGDLVSEVSSIDFDPASTATLDLKLTRRVPARPFTESKSVKLVELHSPSLSAFLGHPFTLRAAVLLPDGWSPNSADTFPTVYFITGFGSDHHGYNFLRQRLKASATRAIFVVPDPTCRRGHSAFADSENNGPWGKALTTELIPEIQRRFHAASDANRRFVTGISSGGWSALWLQVTYPDLFGGCWAHSPDPVDFHDFQRIDLYAPHANMFHDEHNQRRPLARNGDAILLYYDDFVAQETALGEGGQIGSFEAVFSPRLNGAPRPLFDRRTGDVDPITVDAWKRYDIRLTLQRDWPRLAPRLKGKLHVYAGTADNFYLDGAVRLLKDALTTLGSDAEVEIINDMPHTIAPAGWQNMLDTINKLLP